MAKTPVILDTMVLLRGLASKSPYTEVLEKIKEKCNRICVTTSIVKEWKSKASVTGMSSYILLRKLIDLRQHKKLRKCNKTSIEKINKLMNKKRCIKPKDKYDQKFLEAALATKAILITEDSGLLTLNPYTCDKISLDIMRTEEYLQAILK